MEHKKGPLSILEKMKQKAKEQQSYGGDFIKEPANTKAGTCPNCGAGRAQRDGLTHCAYCGFEFLAAKLTDGINIKKEDNSKNS